MGMPERPATLPPFPFGRGVRASRTIALVARRPEFPSLVRAFWGRRGFVFEAGSDGHFVASHGSLQGNMTSFDMARLLTRLNVCLDSDGGLLCEMIVEGHGQIFTLYNRAFWAFELATFEAYLRRGEAFEEEWKAFGRQWRWGSVLRCFTLGLSGRRIGPETQRILEGTGSRLEDVRPYDVH